MENSGKLIFSIASYAYLGGKISRISLIAEGMMEMKKFPDGETYHRIMEDVDGKKIFLVGGTVSEADTLELYDLACGLVQDGARSLNIIIPFYGYSTMERAVKSGEVVKAKTRAMLLSTIPSPPEGNMITLIDLHTEGLPHYFQNGIRTVHLYGKRIMMEAVKRLPDPANVVLASADAGRAKWVESLANDMGLSAGFIHKRRISGEETKISSVIADVKGKDVVIYDDMIRTGGTIVNAAKAYKDAGAKKIYVFTTHGLFSGGGLEKIKNTGLVEFVLCTDTHPESVKIKDPFLKVESVAELISKNLEKHLME